MKKRILSLVLCAAMLLSMCLFLGAGVMDDTTADGSAETTESYIPAVNFTNVAPFVQANAQAANGPARAAQLRAVSAAPAAPQRTELEALVTSKTATLNADGSYKIRLESYSTGTVTQQTTTKPTDIVLVLDQSGSMANSDMSVSSYAAYTDTKNGNLYSNRNNLWYKQGDSYVAVTADRTEAYTYSECLNQNNETYWDYAANQGILYAKVSGQWQKVKVDYTWNFSAFTWTYTYKLPDGTVIAKSNGNSTKPTVSGIDENKLYLRNTYYEYAYSYVDNGIKISLGTSTGADTRFEGAVIYSKTDKTITRLEALQTAVTNFVNQIAQKATEEGVDHRIAIVGFASDDYDNTELLTGCTITEKEVNPSGTYYFPTGNAMNGVQYKSATADDYQNALVTMNTADGKTSAANAIAALTAYGGTETNKGMDMAEKIFENDTKKDEDRNRVVVLFTDGVPGLNYQDRNTNGDYANPAIKSANTISTTYDSTVYTVGIFAGANGANPQELPDNGAWYKGKTVVESTANRFMHLVSSNYPDATAMDRPGSVNPSLKGDDSYYLSAGDADTLNSIFEKIGNNISAPSIELGAEAQVRDIVSPYFTAPANADGVTVYAEKAAHDGEKYTWTRDDTCTGMIAAVNGSTVTVTGFDYDVNFVSETGRNKANPKEDGDFYGRRLVVEFNVTVKPEFLGGNYVPTNLPASGVYDKTGKIVENFKYPTVDIPVKAPKLTAADKNIYYNGAQLTARDLCQPEIPANMDDYVTLSFAADEDISSTKDGNYTVTVTATPKYTIGGQAQNTAAATTTAQVDVYKPEITYQDCTTDYGVAPEYSKANFVRAEWKHGDVAADPESMTGEAPVLTYAYAPAEGTFTKDTYVKVTVTSDKDTATTKISDAVTFVHTADTAFPGCSFDSTKGQFIVHINVFDLTIVKAAADDSKPIDSNQTFVFKVKNNGNGKTIEVVITGPGEQTIKNLPMGSYTITEDTSWSWKYTPVGGSATQELKADNIQNGAATVTFKNENKGTNWLTSLAKALNVWKDNGQTVERDPKN